MWLSKLFYFILVISSLNCLSSSFEIKECGGNSNVLESLTDVTGQISDGNGTYANSQSCTFIIQPTSGNGIAFEITEFELENNSDTLEIYEGKISPSNLVAYLTGKTVSLPYVIYTKLNQISVVFKTDGSVVYSGFKANYTSLEYSCSGKNNCSGNGICRGTNSCICDPGWLGDQCEIGVVNATSVACNNTQGVSGSFGFISDGPGDYTDNAICRFIISPPDSITYAIYIEFLSLSTESGSDYVYVYSGKTQFVDNLIGKYSGNTIPEKILVLERDVLIVFETDVSITSSGFEIKYNITDFQPFNCSKLNNCSNNGKCAENATCICERGTFGSMCELSHTCSTNCSGNGFCIAPEVCECNIGWNGTSCELDIDECNELPCMNYGECQNIQGGYNCLCPFTHTGKNCEISNNVTEVALKRIIFESYTSDTSERNWTVPSGVFDLYISVWGGGGGSGVAVVGKCSCSTEAAYCDGGRGGSGGFTKKWIKVTPGEVLKVYPSCQRSYCWKTSYVKRASDDTTVALAYGGGSGGKGLILSSCSGGKCRCGSPLSGFGGDPEPETNIGVIIAKKGCTSSLSFGCCEPYSDDGISGGQGNCISTPPGTLDINRIPGDGGLVAITPIIFQYPINVEECEYVHSPGEKVKIYDNCFILIKLVDVNLNLVFEPIFAEQYLDDTIITFTNLNTGHVTVSQPNYLIQENSNYVFSFSYQQIGKYSVDVTYKDQQIGKKLIVEVTDQIIFFPSSFAFTLPMGTNRTEKLTITNIGNNQAVFNIRLNESFPVISLENSQDNINLGAGFFLDRSFNIVLDSQTVSTLERKDISILLERVGQITVAIPISLQPTPGPTHAPDSLLRSISQSAAIFEEYLLEIETYDYYGYKRTSGGDTFLISLKIENRTLGNLEYQWSCIDKSDGSYLCTLIVDSQEGLFDLDVYLEDTSYESNLIGNQSYPIVIQPISCNPREVPNSQGNRCVCPSGSYRGSNGLCDPCPVKTFKNFTGDDLCSFCPRNTISNRTHCICSPNAIEVNGQCKCRAGYDDATECTLLCRAGTYSIEGGDGCLECVERGAKCQDGTLQILPNYWWQGEEFQATNESVGILKCRKENVCLSGGEEYLNSENPPKPTCKEGHDPNSPLCSVCLPGYASSGSDSFCHKCWHPGWSWLVVVILVIFILGVAIAVVRRTSRKTLASSVLIRILINYIQVIYIFSKINPFGSELFFDIFSFPNSVASGFTVDFFPIQCALGWDFYERWAFYMSLPLAVLVFPAIIIYCDLKIGNYFVSNKTRANTLYHATVVTLLFLFYTQLSTNVLSIFDCYPYKINGGYPLVASMDIMCGTKPHRIALAFSSLFLALYILGIPAVGFYTIFVNRDRLEDEVVADSYGFLYSGLRTTGVNVFWEIVVIARKVSLIIIATFVQEGYLQTFYSSLLIMVALIAQLIASPYESSRLNAAESLCLLALYITQNISLLYYNENSNIRAITVFLLLLNILVVLFMLYLIAQAIYLERIKEKNISFKDLPQQARIFVSGWKTKSDMDLFSSANKDAKDKDKDKDKDKGKSKQTETPEDFEMPDTNFRANTSREQLSPEAEERFRRSKIY